jgi:hypothetical protein
MKKSAHCTEKHEKVSRDKRFTFPKKGESRPPFSQRQMFIFQRRIINEVMLDNTDFLRGDTMATVRQKVATHTAIKKTPEKWESMAARQEFTAQPQERERKKPGTGGTGKFYRIEVRPKGGFVTYRTQDVGDKGHLERIAGQRSNGSWDTATWLVSKEDAHVNEKGELVIDHPKSRSVLKQIEGKIVHKKGDVFEAKPKANVPESEKPTPAQSRAQQANIKKAQRARAKN